jgi:hypothetical protein
MRGKCRKSNKIANNKRRKIKRYEKSKIRNRLRRLQTTKSKKKKGTASATWTTRRHPKASLAWRMA